MPDLTTLTETKKALRILHDDDDSTLCAYIKAASELVIGYLDAQADTVLDLDSGGEFNSGAVVPVAVRVATQIIVNALYTGDETMKDRPGGIPYQAEMLLYRLTSPPLA